MKTNITGHTGLLALFGHPIGHSGSPAMYNLSFDILGIDNVYLCLDAVEEDIPRCFENVRKYNMPGGNVTMPCKKAALDCMDELSPSAQLIGAVNTFVQKDGKVTGYNTDGIGFVRSLQEKGIDVAGKKLVVVGAGGAATAIQCQSALDGAAEITIFNKKDKFFQGALETAEKIHATCPDCLVNVYDVDDQELLRSEVASCDILVNGTMLGMKPLEHLSIIPDPSMFRPGMVVYDVVYNPLETKLLREAKEAGCICLGGKGMLLWQGVAAFKLFTGQDMPVDEVKRAFYPELL